MERDAKIYIAGSRGLVGSALVRNLRAKEYNNLLTPSHGDLELMDQAAVTSFFATHKPDYVFLAAAKVGGIHANNEYPAEFIHDNLIIQNNVIQAAYQHNVKRLLFLGSSCIYPKHAPQPMKEEYLLTGPLEETNRPYALAKIAGIEMCWSYNRQYGTKYLGVMPTNLFGPGDNYDLNNSHVIPAMIRKLYEAKKRGDTSLTLWGTGTPYREFLYSDDMADACVFLMSLNDAQFAPLLGGDRNNGLAPLINIGVGKDITIAELANTIKNVVGYEGEIIFDPSKLDGTPRKLLDISRLSALNWQAKTPFKAGLELAFKDFLKMDAAG